MRLDSCRIGYDSRRTGLIRPKSGCISHIGSYRPAAETGWKRPKLAGNGRNWPWIWPEKPKLAFFFLFFCESRHSNVFFKNILIVKIYRKLNKNIFNNFLIAEFRRTRTHLFQKLPSPAPESRNAPVLHSLQSSISDQHSSSMGWSLGQLRLYITAPIDETTTTLFTFAFVHAFSTFLVPATAGSISSTSAKFYFHVIWQIQVTINHTLASRLITILQFRLQSNLNKQQSLHQNVKVVSSHNQKTEKGVYWGCWKLVSHLMAKLDPGHSNGKKKLIYMLHLNFIIII